MTVLASGGAFFESPRWHDGSWWASDMFGGRVIRVSPAGEVEQSISVDGNPSGIGWLPDGTTLVVSMALQQVLAVSDREASVYADLGGLAVGELNDMIVDGHGNVWVGYFGFDFGGGANPIPAGLIHLAPDRSANVAATDLMVPNGVVVSSDGRTLVVAETLASRLTAFDIAADGTLHGRKLWAQLGPTPEFGSLRDTLSALSFAPDGIAVDAMGAVWVADAIGGKCYRVERGGDITARISPPEGLAAFACALGGPEGHTLVMTCSPDASERRRRRSPESVLFAVDVA